MIDCKFEYRIIFKQRGTQIKIYTKESCAESDDRNPNRHDIDLHELINFANNMREKKKCIITLKM